MPTERERREALTQAADGLDLSDKIDAVTQAQDHYQDLASSFFTERSPGFLAAVENATGLGAAAEKLRTAMAPVAAHAAFATAPAVSAAAEAIAAQMEPMHTRLVGSLGAHAGGLFAKFGATMPSLAALGVDKAAIDFAGLDTLAAATRPLLGNFDPIAADVIRDQYAGLADRIAETRDAVTPSTPLSDFADEWHAALPDVVEVDTRQIDYLAEMVELERQRMDLDAAREARESRKSTIVVCCGIVGALTSSGALAAILLHL